MTNEQAIEECKVRMVSRYGCGSYTTPMEFYEKCLEALEKQIRIQEIMAMPIQENAVKYLAICGVMDK